MADIPRLTGRHLIRIIQRYNLENVVLAQDQNLIFEVDEEDTGETDSLGDPIMKYTDLIIDLNHGQAEFNQLDSRIGGF